MYICMSVGCQNVWWPSWITWGSRSVLLVCTRQQIPWVSTWLEVRGMNLMAYIGACLKSASISITHTMSSYISMDLSGMGTSPGSQHQRTLRVYSQELQRHPFRRWRPSDWGSSSRPSLRLRRCALGKTKWSEKRGLTINYPTTGLFEELVGPAIRRLDLKLQNLFFLGTPT